MSIPQITSQQSPWHPCMNEQAHARVARLHLPVAPKCNTRCIYCRRGIVPAGGNQTGPGETEAILNPAQALAKTASFLEKWGPDSIVGIAGPGDPLANPETLETIQLLSRAYPYIRLCLCTNGICLPDHVDSLVELGVRHLTVTVNSVAPEIAAQIQPWLRYRDKEYIGGKAADLLIGHQLAGIEAAARRHIFVKVNCVVIPELNGDHILEVVREVKQRGAKMMNLMPLLSGEEKGRCKPPTAKYLRQLQRQAAEILPVFTKCKQCRADAEGIPGRRETQWLKTITEGPFSKAPASPSAHL